MKASRAPMVALLALQVGPRAAGADERPCPAPVVEADADFRARFPEAARRLPEELAGRQDLDSCARVELRLERADLATIVVTLPDGRAAARSGIRRDDLLLTLQALLLLPEPPRAAAAPPEPPPSAVAERGQVQWLGHVQRDESPPAVKQARELGFELSAVGSVRAGDGQVGYGAGVQSFLEVKRWLVGFQGRVVGYRSLRGSDPETALGLGLLAGRRLDLGSVALDLLAGPAFATQGAAFSETLSSREKVSESQAMRPPRSEPSSGFSPRLLLGARLGFSPRSVLRSFVGVDGELGLTRSLDGAFEEGGRLPAYSVGLSLGATVGTR